VVNPRQVRDFAKAMGRLAKTDTLDAAILADFAQRVRPEPRPLPDEAAQLLESLLTRRRQIVEMLTAEKNRLGFARGPVKRDIRQHIRWLEQRLAAVEGDLQDAVAASPLYQAKADLLHSVPVSAKSPPSRSSPRCRSWASCHGTRSPPSSAWPQ
jgi:transposase